MKEEQGRTRKNKEEQGRTRKNKEEQGRTRKNKEEQGRTRKNKEEQGRTRKNKEGIIQKEIDIRDVTILGNRMKNDLFFNLAHTPLSVKNTMKSGWKTVVCMSRHNFSIKEKILTASGLVARNNQQSAKNIISILEQHPETVVLVSQKAKRYFNNETIIQDYKPRIFCLLGRKYGITNKIINISGSKINNVYL